MERTNWNLMVRDNELSTEKRLRKKIYITQKILTNDLPKFVDEGWEKSRDFKSPKYIEVIKEKSLAK